MLSKQYDWINNIGTLPKMVKAFLAVYGTTEIPGPKHNPVIMGWAKNLNIKNYLNDETAWCGLGMAYVADAAGYEVVDSPLWARNWLKWGEKVSTPMFGDMCIFSRDQGGHVGLYIGEDSTHYHIAGMNQSNSTNIVRIAKTRLLGARKPKFKIGAPASRKKYILSPLGKVSENEA